MAKPRTVRSEIDRLLGSVLGSPARRRAPPRTSIHWVAHLDQELVDLDGIAHARRVAEDGWMLGGEHVRYITRDVLDANDDIGPSQDFDPGDEIKVR